MNTILVTKKEYDKAAERFRAFESGRVLPVAGSDEESLAENVRKNRARVVVVGVDSYVGPLYEALEAVGDGHPSALIARFGVGHDGIDKALCRKHGICVTNTPGVLNRSVAEHTFWLIGSLLRFVVEGDAAMRRGEFPSRSGFELSGKTLLVIGAGEIGREVARIARFGFGMRVLAVDSRSLSESAAAGNRSERLYLEENGIERYSQRLDDFLSEADVVSLHLASTESTRHFVSQKMLDGMKTGAVLINASRGPIVDEQALYRALKEKRILGAALDVFESEPYRPVGECGDLRTLDNIVLTPHLGSSTLEANLRMGESVLNNIAFFFEKRYSDMNIIDRGFFS